MSNRFLTFLVHFDEAIHDKNPNLLLNFPIEPEDVQHLKYKKLIEFHEILEGSPYFSDLCQHPSIATLQAEIIHRNLIRIPRDFSFIKQILEKLFPEDALTHALDDLTQVVKSGVDWMEQELAFQSKLWNLKEKGSRFEGVIQQILDSFSLTRIQSATHIVFIRRKNESPHVEDFLRPAFVRKIRTFGNPAEKRIFLDSNIKRNFDKTAKDIQSELAQFELDKPYRVKRPIQYEFINSSTNWDQFSWEGQSAGLAFAYLALMHKEHYFRILAPYLACFGSYKDGRITRVEQIQKKVATAKENGIRVLVVAKPNRDDLQDCGECQIIEYPEGPLDQVLNSIADPIKKTTESLIKQWSLDNIRQTTIQKLQNSNLVELADQIKHVLLLTSWRILDDTKTISSNEADLLVTAPSGQQLLVRCVLGQASNPNLERLLGAITEKNLSMGWLIASRGVDRFVQQKAMAEPTRLRVFSQEEFYNGIFPLDKYFDWLNKEYEKRGIGKYYVDLVGTKPIYDKAEKEIAYDKHNLIDHYIDLWSDDRDQNQVSILGDFGVGKTWFCWQYAHKQLKRYRERPLRERIPLLIPLRDYANIVDIEQLISAFCSRDDIGPVDYDYFDLLSKKGRFLILFDGLDEMSREGGYSSIIRNFDKLAQIAVDNSKVILTCRKTYFKSNREQQEVLGSDDPDCIDLASRPNFQVLYLEEFGAKQIKEVLQNRVSDDWQQYWNHIKETYNLRELAQRPVMLDMTIQTLPELLKRDRPTIVDLYQIYTDQWIEIIGQERSNLDSKTRRQLMLALAWEMYQTNNLEIHYTKIPALVGDSISPTEIDLYDYDIRTQSYLIRNTDGYYFFAHKSFMEFFVAKKLCDEIRLNNSAPFSKHPLSAEITNFLRYLDFDVENLFQWIDDARSNPELKYLAGNVLTLLKHKNFDLKGGDFSSLYLQDANLSGANLKSCRFCGATLNGVNLSDANLTNTNFTGAEMKNLILGVRSPAKGVAFSPNGKAVASGRGDNKIALFRLKSKKAFRLLPGHTDSITSVCFSNDGKMIASTSFDLTAKLWKIDKPTEPMVFEHTSTVYNACFSPDGCYLVTSSADKSIKIWDLRDQRWGEIQQELMTLADHRSTVYTVDFHPEGKYIASGSFDTTVGLWTVSNEADRISVTDFRSLTGHGDLVNGVCFSPDGRFLASSSNSAQVFIWEVESGSDVKILEGHDSIVWSVAYSRDNQYLVSGSSDTTVRVWDAINAKEITVLCGHKSEVWDVCFSPDGELVASGSFDNTVRIWDWKNERCIQVINMAVDHNQKIRCDGMRIGNVDGLSDLQRRFLIQKGALESTEGGAFG